MKSKVIRIAKSPRLLAAGGALPALGILLAACTLPDKGSPSPDPGFPIIDIHTHLFNAHDLPLRGILLSRGVPPTTARALAKVLNHWTPPDQLDGTLKSLSAATDSVDTTRALEARVTDRSNSLDAILTPEEKAALRSYTGVVEAPGLKMLSEPQQADRDIEMVAQALANADFPPAEESSAGLKSFGVADLRGIRDMIGILTTRSSRIPQRLREREYPQVDLFVHHMMDMERTYKDEPRVRFEAQNRRMTALDRMHDGKLLHFTAYDPLRGEASLNAVKEAIDGGAVGVKFYPPSGYRPLGNDDRRIDELNRKLFDYCSENNVPIFTHCSPGGFEAAPGLGTKMGDPVYWQRTLAEFPKLRLCLGHAGGEALWFERSNADQIAFAQKVIQLCRTREHVYCEVGYMEAILQSSGPGAFKRVLRNEIELRPAEGNWALGDKIMYGTDWHMLHQERDHRDFLRHFLTVFEDPQLKPWQRKFFAGNAARFLRLRDLVGDPRFTTAQSDHWKSLAAE